MVVEKDPSSSSGGSSSRRGLVDGPDSASSDLPAGDNNQHDSADGGGGGEASSGDEDESRQRSPLISRHTRKPESSPTGETTVEVGESDAPPPILTPEEAERKRQLDDDAGQDTTRVNRTSRQTCECILVSLHNDRAMLTSTLTVLCACDVSLYVYVFASFSVCLHLA